MLLAAVVVLVLHLDWGFRQGPPRQGTRAACILGEEQVQGEMQGWSELDLV
jgi:hypothetical protein